MATSTPTSGFKTLRPRQGAALLTLLLLGAGLSGCVTETSTVDVSKKTEPFAGLAPVFTANWGGTAKAFFMTVNGTLPATFRVTLTEKGSGVAQEFNASMLVQRIGEKYDIPATLDLAPGSTYRLEAFVGSTPVGHRQFTVRSDGPMDKLDLTAAGTYSFRMTQTNASQSDPSDMRVEGVATLMATPAHTTLTITGTGAVNMTDAANGMTMRLAITEFDHREVDGATTHSSMRAHGPWTMQNNETTGTGNVSMHQQHLGVVTKEDADGAPRAAEATRSVLQMQGTFTGPVQGMTLTSHNTSTTWSRLDNGRTFWLASNESTTVTVGAQNYPSNKSYDGPHVKEENPSILEAMNFSGPYPFPLAAGDSFELTGILGLKARYLVSAAPDMQAAGNTWKVLEVKGLVTAGGSGEETLHVVASGALAGLPIRVRQHLTRGLETGTGQMDLVTIA